MSKAAEVRRLLKGKKRLTTVEIAAKVGCHPGYVRATKGRMLNPGRAARYCKKYYQTNDAYRESRKAWSRHQTAMGLRRKEARA